MQLHLGENIQILKLYPDNYFDSIVTDAPYGLGKEPNALSLLKDWITNGYHEISGSGFMGKKWDSFVPQPIFWKEAIRVLKPGGHVLCFFGTRTYDYGVLSMRLAGFEIRDSLQYLYGSGFPKSHNISKAIDKQLGMEREVVETKETKSGGMHAVNKLNKEQGFRPENYNEYGNVFEVTIPASDEAKKWDGWGTALKPAVELIVLARKPLEKGMTVADNVLAHGTGAINIDATRIKATSEITDRFSLGRFPANLILCHHPDCECVGVKKVKGSNCKPSDIGAGRDGAFSNGIYGAKISKVSISHTDEDGMEEVEDWNCHEDCPIKILDMQSGIKTSGKVKSSKASYIGESNTSFLRGISNENNQHGDTGGASRFFYTTKASKAERNYGMPEGEVNNHPTVKPIKVMEYLVKMVKPIGGKVLDPFVGSGTTGIPAIENGFDFYGIEMEPSSFAIAKKRTDFAKKVYFEKIKKI